MLQASKTVDYKFVPSMMLRSEIMWSTVRSQCDPVFGKHILETRCLPATSRPFRLFDVVFTVRILPTSLVEDLQDL